MKFEGTKIGENEDLFMAPFREIIARIEKKEVDAMSLGHLFDIIDRFNRQGKLDNDMPLLVECLDALRYMKVYGAEIGLLSRMYEDKVPQLIKNLEVLQEKMLEKENADITMGDISENAKVHIDHILHRESGSEGIPPPPEYDEERLLVPSLEDENPLSDEERNFLGNIATLLQDEESPLTLVEAREAQARLSKIYLMTSSPDVKKVIKRMEARFPKLGPKIRKQKRGTEEGS